MIRIISALLIAVAALVPAGAGAAGPVRLAEDAPDSHVGVPGDTLWGISGKFLREPWRWPEVWQLNRQEIRNPHLIYPGQVVVLDRNGPTLRIGRRVGAPGNRPPYEKRFPQIYSDATVQAIQSIPLRIIVPFLSEPLVVEDADDARAGVVVATQEGRVFTGPGDTIFATRIDPQVRDWSVYRKATPLREPVTGEVLGYEAVYLGQARVQSGAGVLVPDAADTSTVTTEAAREGAPIPASLMVTSFKQEIGKGDRLLPAGRPELPSYVPHAPDQDVSGRIVSIYNGVVGAGRYNVIAISLGKRDQIEIGHVLALHRNRGSAIYREDGTGPGQNYRLPEHRYGLAFVFRVFDRLAYALVMESDGLAAVSDSVRKP